MKKPNKKPTNQKRRTSSSSSKDISTHYENIFDNNVNFKERVIYLNDDISEFSLELFQKAFDELESNQEPIRIEIASYGGSVYDMFGMIDRMRESKCHIITRGFGKIMSAATFILAAGDERFMGAHSWFMMHELSSGLEGKLDVQKIDVKHNMELQIQMYKMYERFSKGKTKWTTFRKLCEGKDHYINAQTVLKMGLIEKILGND